MTILADDADLVLPKGRPYLSQGFTHTHTLLEEVIVAAKKTPMASIPYFLLCCS